MITVISPAKNLDFETPVATAEFSQPEFLDQSAQLIEVCRQLTPAELSSLMKISDKLAGLNAARFTQWTMPFSPGNARPAMFAFNGDVYGGLDAHSMDEASLSYAQSHLRILSGLYGLLKPLDLMQAYRLEMGTKLNVGDSANLYQYWQDTITLELNHALAAQNDNVLINLASNEYFSSVKLKQLDGMIITPQFKDEKNGQFKIISFFAKKARGMMARYIIDNQCQNVEDLKRFDTAGYYFDNESSTQTDLVFKRKAV